MPVSKDSEWFEYGLPSGTTFEALKGMQTFDVYLLKNPDGIPVEEIPRWIEVLNMIHQHMTEEVDK